jgi:hypothetical protein
MSNFYQILRQEGEIAPLTSKWNGIQGEKARSFDGSISTIDTASETSESSGAGSPATLSNSQHVALHEGDIAIISDPDNLIFFRDDEPMADSPPSPDDDCVPPGLIRTTSRTTPDTADTPVRRRRSRQDPTQMNRTSSTSSLEVYVTSTDPNTSCRGSETGMVAKNSARLVENISDESSFHDGFIFEDESLDESPGYKYYIPPSLDLTKSDTFEVDTQISGFTVKDDDTESALDAFRGELDNRIRRAIEKKDANEVTRMETRQDKLDNYRMLQTSSKVAPSNDIRRAKLPLKKLSGDDSSLASTEQRDRNIQNLHAQLDERLSRIMSGNRDDIAALQHQLDQLRIGQDKDFEDFGQQQVERLAFARIVPTKPCPALKQVKKAEERYFSRLSKTKSNLAVLGSLYPRLDVDDAL